LRDSNPPDNGSQLSCALTPPVCGRRDERERERERDRERERERERMGEGVSEMVTKVYDPHSADCNATMECQQ